MRGFPLEIQGFADTFVALQQARQRADYALDGRYYKLDVLAEIDAAETAIARLEGADNQHRRIFAAHVLFKRPPRLVRAVPGLEAESLGGAVGIDLAEFFEADGGEELTWAAESSDASLASARVEGGVLRVLPNGEGLEGFLTVRVTATDADGLSAEASFAVEVLPESRPFASGWRLLWLTGGSWFDVPRCLRSTNRNNNGFRVVRMLSYGSRWPWSAPDDFFGCKQRSYKVRSSLANVQKLSRRTKWLTDGTVNPERPWWRKSRGYLGLAESEERWFGYGKYRRKLLNGNCSNCSICQCTLDLALVPRRCSYGGPVRVLVSRD